MSWHGNALCVTGPLCWESSSSNIEAINLLTPGRYEWQFKNAIFNPVLLYGTLRSSHDDAFRWMLQDFNDDKSTLVQVMAWCRQATSHYLSQSWPRYMLSYGITRPQWDNAAKCAKQMILLYWHYETWSTLVQVMPSLLLCTKPLDVPTTTCCHLDH